MLKKYIHRIERLDQLIRIKGTGNPKKLARRFNISERSIYTYINLLKNLGAPIRYSKERRSYYYETDGSISIRFLEKK